MKLELILLLFLVMLTGCKTFSPRPIDPVTNLYKTSHQVSQDDIKEFINYHELHNVKFIYLRAGSNKDEYEAFMRRSLNEMGFDDILNQREFTKLIIKSNNTATIPSVTDLVSLHRASKVFGQFLIVETYLYKIDAYPTYQFEIDVIDPVTGETLFRLDRKKAALWDFDEEVVFPGINALKKWVDIAKTNSPSKKAPIKTKGLNI
jgi:hypothetical protein